MASASPVVLILGAGPNIGQHVARAFAAKGYRVAVASRKATGAADQLHIPSDFSSASAVTATFAKVKEALGIPSVVVYNVATVTPNPPKDPFALSVSDFTKDLTVNTISTFAAAQAAVQGFAQLPESASRTFIYTGNIMNANYIIPPIMDLGVGKSASAHLIQTASAAYKEKGYKFYYADERFADGAPVYGALDGEAAGKHYVELSEGKTQGPWQQTFVKGAGYKSFSN